MFWKTDLLVKNGGEFTLIWLLAHGKAGQKAALNTSILDLDISAKCEALLKYQPTGKLNAEEVRNKMSLYLLAVLQYGIVVAFSRKTELILRKVNEALKLFKPPAPKKITKRKADEDAKKGKRARRNTTAVLQTQEEEAEEEQLIDLRNMPVEEISDRFRVTDMRQITLTEYDQQPQGFFEPDLRDLENMMQFDAEQLSEISREVVDQIFSRPGSRAASVNEELQSLVAELVNGMDLDMVALDPLQRHLSLDAGAFQSTYLEPSDAELARRDTDQPMPFEPEPFVEPMEVDQQQEVFRVEPAVLDPALQLPALTESQVENNVSAEQQREPPTPRRRRIRNLIVDQHIELTEDQVRRNLDNYRDICSSRRLPPQVPKVPAVKDLFAPVLHFLPYRMDKRYEVPAEIQEEPIAQAENIEVPPLDLEFQEPAAEITRPNSEAELARRSSNLPVHEQTPPLEALPMDVQPQVDQQVEPPQVTMDQTQFYEPSQQELNQLFDQENPIFDQPIYDQPIFDQTAIEEGRAPSPIPLAPMDDSLLERIKISKRGRETVEFMEFANQTNKTALVRDFVNLLHLLKHRVVKVEQSVAYGPILVETIE